MSADNNSLGDSSELGAATIIRRFGGQVSFPFGDNAEYDMIVDIGNSLYRVQVKTAHQRDGESGSVRAPLKHESGYGYDKVDAYILLIHWLMSIIGFGLSSVLILLPVFPRIHVVKYTHLTESVLHSPWM